MAKERKNPADSLSAEETAGWLTSFLADEAPLDRRALWRLASWSVAAVGAVVIAVMASQSYSRSQTDQRASADLSRQARQFEQTAQTAQNETRRLASAVDTLNSDRDRLYARISSLEQGLDSVTGSVARQAAKSPAASPAPAPSIDKTAAVPFIDSQSAAPAIEKSAAVPDKADLDLPPIPSASSAPPATTDAALAPSATTPEPDPATAAASPPDISTPSPNVAALAPAQADVATDTADRTAEIAVHRTEFGVDLGAATTVEGLRGLWSRAIKAHDELKPLRPLIAVRELARGGRTELRLVAGPLDDAAAAARICANLAARRQACATSVFDGQQLAMDAAPVAAQLPPRHRAATHRKRRVIPAASPLPLPSADTKPAEAPPR